MIQINSDLKSKLGSKSDIVLFCYEDKKPSLDHLLGPSLKNAYKEAKEEGFKGQPNQISTITVKRAKAHRYLFVGLGKEKDADIKDLQMAASQAYKTIKALNGKQVVMRPTMIGSPKLSAQAITEGIILGQYEFLKYSNQKIEPSSIKSTILIAQNEEEKKQFKSGIELGQIFASATTLVRDLINTPPSDMTSEEILKEARSIAKNPIRLKVIGKPQMKKMGMGGLLGVNRGSAKPPYLIHFIYKPKGRSKRKIGFCGKGITFDSGGLSLKPPKAMETMKMDMSGAATVLGLFNALRELKPKIEVHGIAVLTDNMPGPTSVKPGDVLKAMNGKTIEVLNTDAEGRLVLADALSYASKLNCDELHDIATLTGAATIALGNGITSIMGTSSLLIEKIKEATALSGEKVWELPLEKEYESHIKSQIADIKNMGLPMQAGTIIGGIFLKQFVKEGTPWVHHDIASTSWAETVTPLTVPGGTGSMVRTLLHHVLSYN